MLKDKIKVGDYVRTEYGISKVEEDRRIHYGLIHPVIDILKQEAIIKSSPNIMDLIEVGDILSFEDGSICRVCGIEEDYYLLKDYGGLTYWERQAWLEDLMSIVTHEQMEVMEYKIER